MFSSQTLMIVEPGLKLWGSERALAATLKALTEAWGRVVLVVPPHAELADEVLAQPDRYGPVEVVEAPIGNLHKRGHIARLRALAVLAGLTLKLGPRRIYLNQAGLVRMLAPLAWFFRVPLAVHVRLLEDVPRVLKFKGTPRSSLDAIFISDAMYEIAGKIELPAWTRWLRVYDPYALGPVPPSLPEKAPFVCVGRLSHGKGVHLLVEALRLPSLSDAHADIFGAGVEGDDYCSKLEDLVHPLKDRVRLMGFHRDVVGHLPAYRFLVSTSQFESLGRVVMEAWEAGLVPIAFAGSGGAAEMVRKSGGGLLYESWDAISLAGALETALAMSEFDRRRLVEAGRSWMAQSLDLKDYRAALLGVLF